MLNKEVKGFQFQQKAMYHSALKKVRSKLFQLGISRFVFVVVATATATTASAAASDTAAVVVVIAVLF